MCGDRRSRIFSSTTSLGLLALLVVVAVGATGASGQEVSRGTRVWLDVGPASGGGGGVESGLGMLVQLNVQRRPQPHHFGLRLLGLGEFKDFPDGGDGGVGDFGVVYGRSGIASWGHATVAGGLAWVTFDHCPDGPGRAGCSTVGVPLVAEAAVESSVVGLGLQIFADLNATSSFAGASLFLQLGWTP